MSKRLINNQFGLELLEDWFSSEFPHSVLKKPKSYPALFVYFIQPSNVVTTTIEYVWIYPDEFIVPF